MYFDAFVQFQKTLHNLDACLEKATAFAKEKSVDVAVLPGLRLAVDQFPLYRQVQIACDTAKLGASRLTGKDAPSHADGEQSIAELRTRIESVRAYLATLQASDFSSTATRVISQPRWEGKTMSGHDYFLQHVTPNFFFHVTTAYAILRHAGAPLGKRDYLGALTYQAPA